MAVQVKCDEKKQVAFVPVCGHFHTHPSQSARRMGQPAASGIKLKPRSGTNRGWWPPADRRDVPRLFPPDLGITKRLSIAKRNR